MYAKILAAHEHFDDALHALDKAAVLATALRAELFVLGILSPSPGSVLNLNHRSPDDLVGSPAFNALHARAQAWAEGQTVPARLETRVGNAVQLIEHYAREIGANLLVLGDAGHRGGWASLLENSAERMSLRAGCDVLVVR